jgi:hypothetical protein
MQPVVSSVELIDGDARVSYISTSRGCSVHRMSISSNPSEGRPLP